MGTKMGNSYANPLVGYIGHHFFNQCNGPKPTVATTVRVEGKPEPLNTEQTWLYV